MTAHEFLWFDLETTGLDPHTGLVLEFAAVLCEDARGDDFAIRAQYTGVIHHDDAALERAKPALVVQKMHHANGLWRDVRASTTTIAEADAFLAGVADALAPGRTHAIRLAGSSVHFDYRWACVHLPAFAKRVSHRLLDVRVLRTAVETWAQGEIVWPVRDTHRALPDILTTIEEARFARKAMGWT